MDRINELLSSRNFNLAYSHLFIIWPTKFNRQRVKSFIPVTLDDASGVDYLWSTLHNNTQPSKSSHSSSILCRHITTW